MKKMAKRIFGKQIISFVIVLSMLAGFIIMPQVNADAVSDLADAINEAAGENIATADGITVMINNSDNEEKEIILTSAISIAGEDIEIKVSENSKGKVTIAADNSLSDTAFISVSGNSDEYLISSLSLSGINIKGGISVGDNAILTLKENAAIINPGNTAVETTDTGVIEFYGNTSEVQGEIKLSAAGLVKVTDLFNDNHAYILDLYNKSINDEIVVQDDATAANQKDLIAYFSAASGSELNYSNDDKNTLIKSNTGVSENAIIAEDGTPVDFKTAVLDSSGSYDGKTIKLIKDIEDFEGMDITNYVQIDGAGHKISLASNASKFFNITLDMTKRSESVMRFSNIILEGTENASKPIIEVTMSNSEDPQVYGDGLFIGKNTVLTGNKLSSGNGAAVYVNNCPVVMNGAEIYGNEAKNYGGGMYFTGKSTFIMQGGKIYDNTAGAKGGGVALNATRNIDNLDVHIYGEIVDNKAGVTDEDVSVMNGSGNSSLFLENNGFIKNLCLEKAESFTVNSEPEDSINITLGNDLAQENIVIVKKGSTDLNSDKYNITNAGLKAKLDNDGNIISASSSVARISPNTGAANYNYYDSIDEAWAAALALTQYKGANISESNPVQIELIDNTMLDKTLETASGKYISLIGKSTDGNDENHKITRADNFDDVMFKNDGYLKFTNISLDGSSDNTVGYAVEINSSGAKFELGNNASVENNSGGAVNILNGIFNLNNGAIRGCDINAGDRMQISGNTSAFENSAVKLAKGKFISIQTAEVPELNIELSETAAIGDKIIEGSSSMPVTAEMIDPKTGKIKISNSKFALEISGSDAVLTEKPLSVELGASDESGRYYTYPNAQVNGSKTVKSIELIFSDTPNQNDKIEIAQNDLNNLSNNAVKTIDTDYIKLINIEDGVTADKAETFLRTVKFSSDSKQYIKVILSSEIMEEPVYYNVKKGHYYKYNESKVAWDAAYNAALDEEYNGYKGYLVTVTDEQEQNYLDKISDNKSSWLGASRADMTKDLDGKVALLGTYGSDFSWISGSEGLSDNAKMYIGKKFEANSDQSGANYTYGNWHEGEPNNDGKLINVDSGAAFVGMEEYNGKTEWGDYTLNSDNISGYFVEFGGLDSNETEQSENIVSSNGIIGNTAAVSIGNTDYRTLNDAIKAAVSGSELTVGIRINKDIDMISEIEDSITIPLGKTIVLNGQSHTIKRSKSLADEPMINVSGNLTVNDLIIDGGALWNSAPDITSRKNTGVNSAAPVINVTGGNVRINNSTIQNNFNDDSVNFGAINISGGNVEFNNTKINNNYSKNGGAVYVKSANAKFTKGEIKDNIAEENGGAIYITGGAAVTLESEAVLSDEGDTPAVVSITNNYAENGGAIYIYGVGYDDSKNVGKLISNDADIKDNKLTDNEHGKGPGIYLGGLFTLNGGNIEDIIYVPADLDDPEVMTKNKFIEVNQDFSNKNWLYTVDAFRQEGDKKQSPVVVKCPDANIANNVKGQFAVYNQDGMALDINKSTGKGNTLVVRQANLTLIDKDGKKYYELRTKTDWDLFAQKVAENKDKPINERLPIDAHLMRDINLNGSSAGLVGDYYGTFEGNNNTISNLNITGTTENNVGLFSTVSGTVKNLKVSGNVSGNHDVGGIAGRLINGKYNKDSGKILDCSFDGKVYAEGGQAGGIVGLMREGTAVINCANYADVEMRAVSTGDLSAADSLIGSFTPARAGAGGIVGYLFGTNSNKSYVLNCFNAGQIVSKKERDPETYAGGIAGYTATVDNISTPTYIDNVYNVGKATVSYNVAHVGTICPNQGGLSIVMDRDKIKEKSEWNKAYAYYKAGVIDSEGTTTGGSGGDETPYRARGHEMTDADMKSDILLRKLNANVAIVAQDPLYASYKDDIHYWVLPDDNSDPSKSDYEYPIILSDNTIPVAVTVMGGDVTDGKLTIREAYDPQPINDETVTIEVYENGVKIGETTAAADSSINMNEDNAANIAAVYPSDGTIEAGIHDFEIVTKDDEGNIIDFNKSVKQPLKVLSVMVNENGVIEPTNASIQTALGNNQSKLWYLAKNGEWKAMSDAGTTPEDIAYDDEKKASFRTGTSSQDESGLKAYLTEDKIAPYIELEKDEGGKYTGYILGIQSGMEYSYTNAAGETVEKTVQGEELVIENGTIKFSVPLDDMSSDPAKRTITFKKIVVQSEPEEGAEPAPAAAVPQTALDIPASREQTNMLTSVKISNYNSETGQNAVISNANDIQYSVDKGCSWNYKGSDDKEIDKFTGGDVLVRDYGTDTFMPSTSKKINSIDAADIIIGLNEENKITVEGKYSPVPADKKIKIKATITLNNTSNSDEKLADVSDDGSFSVVFDNLTASLGVVDITVNITNQNDENPIDVVKTVLLLIVDEEEGIIKGINQFMTSRFKDDDTETEFQPLENKGYEFKQVDGVSAMDIPEDWYNHKVQIHTPAGDPREAVATLVIGPQNRETTTKVGMDIQNGLLTNVGENYEYSTDDGNNWKTLTEKLESDMFDGEKGKSIQIHKKSTTPDKGDSIPQILQLADRMPAPQDIDPESIIPQLQNTSGIILIKPAVTGQVYSVDENVWSGAMNGQSYVSTGSPFTVGTVVPIYTRVPSDGTKFPSISKSLDVEFLLDDDGNLTYKVKARTPDEIPLDKIHVDGNKITVEGEEGLEYRLAENPNEWVKPKQLDDGTFGVEFKGLNINTEYTVQARKAETANLKASDPTKGTKVTTGSKEYQDPPTKDEIKEIEDNITTGSDYILIKPANPEFEYSIDKITWKETEKDTDGTDFVRFDGLEQGKTYTVYIRRKGDDTKNPSDSEEIKIDTKPAAQPSAEPTSTPIATAEPTATPKPTKKPSNNSGGGGGGGGGGSRATAAPKTTTAPTTVPTAAPTQQPQPTEIPIPELNKTGKVEIAKTMDVITTAVIKGGEYAGRHLPTYIVTDENGETTAFVTNLEGVEFELIYTTITFNDMIKHWAKNLVNEAAKRRIVKGYEDDSFKGDNLITRAEFAAIVTRALGLLPREKDCFLDVEPEHWFYGEVATAYEFGIIKGVGEGKFEPNRTITREEGMLMIKRAGELVNYSPEDMSIGEEKFITFADYADVSPWAESGVKMCLSADIINGRTPWQLAPQYEMTRAETAAIIMKLLVKAGLINDYENNYK